MQNLGTILRTERERKQLALNQVARQLHIDSGLLSKIETNKRSATKQQVLVFAELYCLDPDQLFIEWYSDKIIRDIQDATFKQKVMAAAIQKINANNP